MDPFQTAELIAKDTLERFSDKPAIFHIEYMKAKLSILGLSAEDVAESVAWTTLKYF